MSSVTPTGYSQASCLEALTYEYFRTDRLEELGEAFACAALMTE
jgi:hypothetical protein